ncbi:MAG: YecA family protein [Gammaproteobacteria bacterium]|nr:YecA family protein [Gammaproteobacteria bacterium]
MNTRPDIEILDAALFKVHALMGASESHGVLCGMLCARGAIELSEWVDHVLGEQEEGNVLLHETVRQLSELHQLTMEKVNDYSGEFFMLLPDDDYDLVGRTEALANWCQGFVYGLAAGGISRESKLPEDSAEILQDFIEISRAGYADDDEQIEVTEEDEQAFVEVVEYVRTGVMLINEELQTLIPSTTLH